MPQKFPISNPTIHAIGITEDTLTDRGGLALFLRYVDRVNVLPLLGHVFRSLRRSRKGLPLEILFKQVLAFFADGTSFALTRFDEVKREAGWAGILEIPGKLLASSHMVKRFFKGFGHNRIWWFRSVFQEIFLWRLQVEQPNEIILGLDTTILDNDDAKKREGVSPTYRGVIGFAPLLLSWGPYLIDAVFRGGKKHGNHGETVVRMVEHVVEKIRARYRMDIPILLVCDAAFFDQVNFDAFDRLGIAYIVAGRVYEDLKNYVAGQEGDAWGRLEGEGEHWEWMEVGSRRKSWSRFRRAVYWRYRSRDGQLYLDLARPDRVVYTNLGVHTEVTETFNRHGVGHYADPAEIVRLYHGRGRDELVIRAMKDFGTERMPMKNFLANAAYFYSMALSFVLYEAFKVDVAALILPVTAYATTVRRTLFDFAAKLVTTGRRIILKVTSATFHRVKLDWLWEAANAPPPISPLPA